MEASKVVGKYFTIKIKSGGLVLSLPIYIFDSFTVYLTAGIFFLKFFSLNQAKRIIKTRLATVK